ncbi:phospholipid-transporting ATPase ABCA3-like isoform X2 [Euwallacea fornicatus]|uniref:phospholipid-transporting ATPase ABCA3-like isoform X2 n=1 Tax=Euwallacea fornicatus TaxID=995702 RepID=UPI0033901487
MWKDQLKVILWKNLIIRKRHWFLTICEALIPVLLFLLIAYGRSKITGLNKRHIVNVTYNKKYPIDYDFHNINLGDTQWYFTPLDEYFWDIIRGVQEKLQIINNNIQGFPTQGKLMEAYAQSTNGTTIALIFNSLPGSPNLDYTVRYHKQLASWSTDRLYENSLTFQSEKGSTYQHEGFLVVQKAVDMSFIENEVKRQGGKPLKLTVEVQEFPYPPYNSDDGILSMFILYLPLMTLFSFIVVCPAVLKRVVEEKYSGIKELMRMVGMKSWMLWFGWFIYSIIPMFFSVLLIVLIMKVDLFEASYPAIEYTNAGILIIFLMLYCITVTINCFFLSTLFYKPTLATLVGLLLWILSYFVPKHTLDENTNVSYSTSMFIMLLPNMALHYGFMALSNYEIREIGVQWTNWHLPGGGGTNEVTMLDVCLMLIIDCAIYLILALYVDAINPGKYGVPKSVFFPFKWISSCIKKHNNVDADSGVETYHLQEMEVGRLPKGIELINLSKTYGKKIVVQNLSLDIYQDQITVLLGHNGAGKSTTMGMITGMIKKSGGHIVMNGKEIRSNSDVTQSIGLCPQHNLFFPDLTVAEHLKFFAMMKGKSFGEAERELNDLLELLHLTEKKNDMAHTLSGGMKRKLCLGMAVIGGSKVLILDEPSSGMDPQSRRHMWDLLLQWRNQKTILITTHFMEEADALGDWIAIMNEGKLLCYGTPMYLKKIYDTGSNLILLIEKNQDLDKVVKNIEKEIGMHINNVKCKSINGNEVQFLIPSGNYVKMFQHLEANKEKFHIENISFTNTTLEDVFLNSKIAASDIDDKSDEISLADSIDSSSYMLTLQALLFKRYRFIYQKFMSYVIPSAIALGFLLLCIFLGATVRDNRKSGGPPIKLSLSTYDKTMVYLNQTQDPQVQQIKGFYQKNVVKDKSVVEVVGDVSEAIVKEGVANLPYYRHHMVVAAELTNTPHQLIEAVALYNNFALHSAPISVNLITNSFAQLVLGPHYSISTTNHPLESINTQISPEQLSKEKIGLLWLIIMPLGFLFFLGSFIYFPFMELSTNFTQLQFMCGVRPSLYWTITFLCDLLVYVVFAFIMVVISLAWTPFRGINEFGSLYLILFLYGLSGIPFSYLFGRKNSFSGAFALFIILGIMLGVLLTIIVCALEESASEPYVYTGGILKDLFLIFCPQFGLTYNGVVFSYKVINNYNFMHMDELERLSICSLKDAIDPCCYGESNECDKRRSYMAMLAPHIYLMCAGAVFYLAINMFLDSYCKKKISNCLSNLMNKIINRKNVNNNNGNNLSILDGLDNESDTNVLRVKKLKKSYSGKQVVNNVSLNLKKGECMGILGVNGAGKSTTFRMLTREEVKDKGEIKISNINIDNNQYLKKLGYCPQNDALNYSLTGRDILKTMAMLRGIRDDRIVDNFLDVFGLKEFADIPCEQYSGGNKRKLSFAVAVIGFPDFILLDEPTNGVDPLSRRRFWTLIKEIKKLKQNSFILTSHSMAECEAVCNDLKIMKQGTIKKEGTISKLKNEIAGFNVMLKLKPPHSEPTDQDEVDGGSTDDNIKTLADLKTRLKNLYPEGEIKDEHSGLLHFYIKTEDKKWAQLFEQFEDLKLRNRHLIEDYSISEASLEDVFLEVAKLDKSQKPPPSPYLI